MKRTRIVAIVIILTVCAFLNVFLLTACNSKANKELETAFDTLVLHKDNFKAVVMGENIGNDVFVYEVDGNKIHITSAFGENEIYTELLNDKIFAYIKYDGAWVKAPIPQTAFDSISYDNKLLNFTADNFVKRGEWFELKDSIYARYLDDYLNEGIEMTIDYYKVKVANSIIIETEVQLTSYNYRTNYTETLVTKAIFSDYGDIRITLPEAVETDEDIFFG